MRFSPDSLQSPTSLKANRDGSGPLSGAFEGVVCLQRVPPSLPEGDSMRIRLVCLVVGLLLVGVGCSSGLSEGEVIKLIRAHSTSGPLGRTRTARSGRPVEAARYCGRARCARAGSPDLGESSQKGSRKSGRWSECPFKRHGEEAGETALRDQIRGGEDSGASALKRSPSLHPKPVLSAFTSHAAYLSSV